MKLSPGILLVASAAFLGACQSQPDVKKVQEQNIQLQGDLKVANENIAQLQLQELKLRQNIAELHRVNNVLDTEKSSRVQESSELRGQVRRFVQNQIDAYKNFMVQGGLLDYVGGELVERSNIEEKPLLLVDLMNTIPGPGTLTGVGAHFVKPGTFTVKVLRPVDDKLVVIWDSNPLKVDDVHGGDSLPLCVLGVSDSIADNVFEENLKDSTSFLVDETRNTLHTTSTSKTTDSRLRDTLDVITKNLAMPLGTTFSKTLSSLTTSRHFEQSECQIFAFFSFYKFRNDSLEFSPDMTLPSQSLSLFGAAPPLGYSFWRCVDDVFIISITR